MLPRIGISSCLIGQRVRYNGEAKRHDWIADDLAKWVSFVPLCPEMAMGMGVPRESVRLLADPTKPGGVRMEGNQTHRDYTELALQTSQSLLKDELDLDGYILKKDSPSCGKDRVRIYQATGIPSRDGSGLFARELISRFPELPVIEEGRLCDPAQREHFVMQVFGYHLLKKTPHKAADLQRFHQRYKYVIMSHSPAHVEKLGRLAANSEKAPIEAQFARYRELFVEAIRVPSNRNKRVNVLHHVFGYLKKKMDREERHQVLETIEEYRSGEVPLVVPVRMIHHMVRRFAITYLEDQVFFHPYPRELGLQNQI